VFSTPIMSNERLSSASPELPQPQWHIEEIPANELNINGIELCGFRLCDPGLESSGEFHGRTIRISGEGENTKERARSLRLRTLEVLRDQFGLVVDDDDMDNPHTKANYVLGELVQNAYRYSDSGPVWLTIVTADERPDIIDITVANIAPVVSKTSHLPDDEHGRGGIYLDVFSERHGIFDLNEDGSVTEHTEPGSRGCVLVAAAALVASGIKPPVRDDLSTAA
jgi:hypothetical protein